MRGKKPNHISLKQLSIRLDLDVYDYIAKHYPSKIQATIRAVLRDFVNSNGERNDNASE